MMRTTLVAVLLLCVIIEAAFGYYTRSNPKCAGDKSARRECGWAGISPHMCERQRHPVTGESCCFDDRHDDYKWCFHAFDQDAEPATSDGDDNNAIGSQSPYVAATTKAPDTTTTTTTTAATTTTAPRRFFWNFFGNRRRTPPATTTLPPTTTTTTTTTQKPAPFKPTADLLGNTVPTGPIFPTAATLPRTQPPNIFDNFNPVSKKPTSGESASTDGDTDPSRNNFANFLDSLGLEVDHKDVVTVSPGTGALGTNIAASVRPPTGGSKVDTSGVDVTTAICSYFAQNNDVPEQVQSVFEDSLGDCDGISATVPPEVANAVLYEEIQKIIKNHVSDKLPDSIASLSNNNNNNNNNKPSAADLLNNPNQVREFILGGNSDPSSLLQSISTNGNRQPANNLFGNIFGQQQQQQQTNPFAAFLGGNNMNNNNNMMNMMMSMLNNNNNNNNPYASLLGGNQGGGVNQMLANLLGGSSSGGGGIDQSTLMMINMMQNQMKQQQQAAAATANTPTNIGLLQPNYVPTKATPRKQPSSFLCNFYLSRMEEDKEQTSSITQLVRVQFMQSGCLQSILSNPSLLLQQDGLKRIKQILGLTEKEDPLADAANAPIDLALVTSDVLTECLRRRDEFVANYNCKVGFNINIRTEQECLNIGCLYAPGNRCFKCPLIKKSAEMNKEVQETCALRYEDRQACSGFERFYTITSIFGRSTPQRSPTSNIQALLRRNPSSSSTSSIVNPISAFQGSAVTGAASSSASSLPPSSSLLGSRFGGSPTVRQGFSSSQILSMLGGGGGAGLAGNMFGGGGTTNSLQQMLINQLMGSGANSGLFGSASGNFFGGQQQTSQQMLSNVLLKNKCEQLGCCWDADQAMSGISSKACYTKSIPQSEKNLIQNCYDTVTCGIPSSIFPRIVGGTEAGANTDRPWQALLRVSGFPIVRCSGVLICNTWVLTTASCLPTIKSETSPLGFKVAVDTTYIEVWLGSIDPVDPENNGGVKAVVKSFIPHPSYVISQNVHDIALIRIEPITPTTNIRPICLPTWTSESPSAGQTLYVAGFGSPGGQTNQAKLREIVTKTINNQACIAKYKSTIPIADFFCTEPVTAGEDTCKGDGGSPALMKKGNSFVLAGLNFGGSPNCDGSSPMVFTDIARYRHWITQTTNGCCATSDNRLH